MRHSQQVASQPGSSNPIPADDTQEHHTCHDDHHQDSQRLAEVSDTVGCIVVEAGGKVSAGVSSGGLAIKFPGRVGEAAIHGAGCWADDGDDAAGVPGELCVGSS